MSSIQIAAINHGINVPKVSQLRHSFHCGPCLLPMRFDPLFVSSLSLRTEHSSRQSLHVCFAGGQGMMENNGRKSLQEAMGQLKGQSLEDMLREQMQKGGSGGSPPGGRGGSGGGGSSSGSDGMSNESLQIVLATASFILMYIFVIDGLELIKLARDCIKFVSGKGQSVRLKRATYKWVRLYNIIIEKKEAIKNGLEKASTYWFHPDFFRGLLRRHYIKSNPQE
ncbi:uncharacterized protein LOC109803489 isoform X2 [Cajanus cajan]|uniref:uncharacterized protein LOC109803489 isoform X2 n=1 Tax=Cajanus cajan TaxID=3821 RepID=UPI00098DC6DA|nr:uncharacterized protein LOC109803489 isoform X2 [Cajanus cajan]